MAEENPDIIVVTGNLVDSSHTDLEIALDFLEEAQKIAPIYYVNGLCQFGLRNPMPGSKLPSFLENSISDSSLNGVFMN